jgi:hypothetical protein
VNVPPQETIPLISQTPTATFGELFFANAAAIVAAIALDINKNRRRVLNIQKGPPTPIAGRFYFPGSALGNNYGIIPQSK